MPFAFFSNRRHGRAGGPLHYGEECVEVRLPRAVLIEDDAFHDGQRDYRVRLSDLRSEHFVAAHQPAPVSAAGRRRAPKGLVAGVLLLGVVGLASVGAVSGATGALEPAAGGARQL